MSQRAAAGFAIGKNRLGTPETPPKGVFSCHGTFGGVEHGKLSIKMEN